MPDVSLLDAVVRGARVQFRPRLILIVVAACGMLPAALARGIGSDIQRPLATVVIGGLCSTLFLTLFALPAVYWLTETFRPAVRPRPDPRG
jgi:cobalt-zinc-cadmium resistance protein CzcA